MAELYCDICGRAPVRAQILVEGAKLLACGACMKSGKVIHRFEEEEGEEPIEFSRPSPMEPTEEVTEGFGKIIKDARDRAKLPLAVVAERISEKESYLDAIENERLTPSIAVARKLEKELGIKLVEKVQPSVAPSTTLSKSKSPSPTLADMIEPAKKKKGK